MNKKECTKCEIVKPLSDFRPRNKSRDGCNSQCRKCEATYQREYYAANVEKMRERKRLHMAKARQDPEKRKRMNAARRGNKRIARRQKIYLQRLKNEHFFIWRARNWSSRRSVKISALDLWHLWKSQRGLCALSKRKLDNTAHLDHVIHCSNGGGHDLFNLRWLDPMVNVARGNMSDSDFVTLCHQIVDSNSK